MRTGTAGLLVGDLCKAIAGVEMEALTGASAACLTIYDMLKYKAKSMVISEIKLMEKTGGKSGDYKRLARRGGQN